jgi:predicted RNA-binding protein with RPS1 domain
VELSKINDDRVTLIQEYAKNYEQMTDAVADRIARGALDLEVRRNALKQKYYDRLKSALSPKTAARFLQVENQLLMIIDLQISAALPVVK